MGSVRHQSAREPAARTYARALPVVPVRARGLTIEGADGRRYLDCVSGAGTLTLGHNHPVVLEAIRGVLDSGAPLQVVDLATPVGDAFVTELLRTLPPGLAAHARVRFCGPGPAGADPVATAVGLVRAATGRSRVVAFTDDHRHLGPTTDSGLARVPYGWDLDRPSGRDGDEPAGVVLEPVRGDGGVLPTSDAWLRRMRRLTAERGIALIADESATGVGWTGAFWAVEHSGVTPDVLVLGRAIGGSLPLAAVVHRDDLDGETPGTGAFRGNQLALAAGTATLAHVREHRLADRAAVLGDRIRTRLRALADAFACVGEVRGRGLMTGIELAAPDGTRDGAAELAAAVRQECLHRGLIVDVTGPSADVVRLLPPLIVTEEQTAAVLDRLADAVAAVDRRSPLPAPLRAAHGPH